MLLFALPCFYSRPGSNWDFFIFPWHHSLYIKDGLQYVLLPPDATKSYRLRPLRLQVGWPHLWGKPRPQKWLPEMTIRLIIGVMIFQNIFLIFFFYVPSIWMCSVTACQHFTALSHLHLLKDQCSVMNWSDPDIKYTMPCTAAHKPFIKTRPKGNFTGSAMDAKGPIVHQGCLTVSGWRAKRRLSCLDKTHGGKWQNHYVWQPEMRTHCCVFILLKYFGSLTASQCPALYHTMRSSQKNMYVHIFIYKWQFFGRTFCFVILCFILCSLSFCLFFLLLSLISFLFWLSWLASPTADYPAVFQCICPPPVFVTFSCPFCVSLVFITW